MSAVATDERVPIGPWRDWVVDQLRATSKTNLALRLGCDEISVRRWEAGGYTENGRWIEPTDISIARVDELLTDTATTIDELYPVDIDLEPDAYCGRCHELVTPIDGACPWCDGTVTATEGRGKRYCARCDKLIVPANNGRCWRCDGPTETSVPWRPCACGCGTMKRSFDPQGRRARYIRGHAPRSLEDDTRTVPTEPFARYLEQQLRDLDVIAALARAHGMSRDQVVAVLQRRDPTVDRTTVRRAVWAAARGGTGKGLPARPGAIGFFDLYPDDKRSKTCPGCGQGKAAHAEMCKQCRRKQGGPGAGGGPRPPQVSDDIIERAYRAYQSEGLSQLATAKRFLKHVPAGTAQSFAHALRREWRARGWPTRTRSRVGAQEPS